MIGFYRGIVLAGGIVAATTFTPALAQENLDAGKTPAQLFAADCAICHKSPQGLSKGAGVFGLPSFLREHYTASREAAAAIAAYIQSVDKGPPEPAKRPASKRNAKGDEKGKPGEAKPEQIKSAEPKSAEPKTGDTKTGDTKAGETKPADAKPSDAKPGEAKASDAKAAEPKAAETKPAEPKAEAKPAEPKSDGAKPAAKDEAPEKKPE